MNNYFFKIFMFWIIYIKHQYCFSIITIDFNIACL